MSDLRTSLSVKDGQMTVYSEQDCTPIAEYTKARHNEGLHGSSEMKLAASIPLVFFEKYCNDNKVDFADVMRSEEHLRRIVNDPSLAYFRVWKGRF